MPTYYSPTGNPEVWEEKPDGYYTPEEWQAAHPAPQPEPLTPEEQQAAMLAEFTETIQHRLDAFAQTRGYDNIMSACSYFGSANPRFKAEADVAIRLRDETWAACYAILEAVLAGERPAPTLEALFAELPPLEW